MELESLSRAWHGCGLVRRKEYSRCNDYFAVHADDGDRRVGNIESAGAYLSDRLAMWNGEVRRARRRPGEEDLLRLREEPNFV